MASDGGMTAAAGLRYQYLRTIEALLDLVVGADDRKQLVTEDRAADVIDYSIRDGDRLILAVQVKYAIDPSHARPLTGPDLLAIVRALTEVAAEGGYRVETNRRLSKQAEALVKLLRDSATSATARQQLADQLGGAASPAELVERIDRLGRCTVQSDPRTAREVYESVRARLRQMRVQGGVGVGDGSSRVLVNHVISEVFQRSAEQTPANVFTLADLRHLIFLPDLEIADALGRYDWAIPIGPVPSRPTVTRASAVGEIVTAFMSPASSREPGRCAVVGLSGIGKTSLAATYAHEFAAAYDRVVWIDCESEDTLRAAMIALMRAEAPDVGQFDGLNDAELAQQCQRMFARSLGTWLLVFDGVDAPGHIKHWLPTTGRVDSLVTSTRTQDWLGWQLVNLAELSDNEADELILDRLGLTEPLLPEQRRAVDDIVAATDRWPLAIDLACAYLVASDRGLDVTQEYLTELGNRIYHAEDLLPSYPRSLVTAVRLALSMLPDGAAGAQARRAIAALAYLPATGVPMKLAVQAAEVDRLKLEPDHGGPLPVVGPLDVDDVFRLLRSRGLIRRHKAENPISDHFKDLVVINEVVLHVVRALNQERMQEPAILTATLTAASLWLVQFRDNQDFRSLDGFLPVCTTLTRRSWDCGVTSSHGIILLGNIAETFMNQGQFERAVTAFVLEHRMIVSVGQRDSVLSAKVLSAIALCALESNREPPEVLDRLISALDCVEVVTRTSCSDISDVIFRLQSIVDSLRRSRRADEQQVDEIGERLKVVRSRYAGRESPHQLVHELLSRLDLNDDEATIEMMNSALMGASLQPMHRLYLHAGLVEAHTNCGELGEATEHLESYAQLRIDQGFPENIGQDNLTNAAAIVAARQLSVAADITWHSFAWKLLDLAEGEKSTNQADDYAAYRRRVVRAVLAAVHEPLDVARTIFEDIGPPVAPSYAFRSTNQIQQFRSRAGSRLAAREREQGARR